MTDLTLAVKLTADGRGLVGELRGGKAALDQLRATLGEAGRAASAMGADLAGLARQSASAAQAERAAEQQRRADVRASAEAVREAKRQEREARRQADAEAKAIRAAEQAREQEARNAQRTAQGEFRRSQLAVRNLGFQISDIGTGLASGQSPFIILAQQSGQVAQALSGMQGAAGVAGRFLAGPFGAFVVSAVSVLGALFLATRDAEQASNSHTDALDEQEQAFKRLRDAGKDAIATTREQTQETLRNAEADLKSALAKREKLEALLKEQRAALDAGSGGFGEDAALSVAGASQGISSIEREIAGNATAIDELKKTIFGAESQLRDFRVKAAADVTEALKQSYETEVALIERRRAVNQISEQQALNQRLVAQRRYNEALKQAQTSDRSASRADSAQAKAAKEALRDAEKAAELAQRQRETFAAILEDLRSERDLTRQTAEARQANLALIAAQNRLGRPLTLGEVIQFGSGQSRAATDARFAADAAAFQVETQKQIVATGDAAAKAIDRVAAASDEAASQFIRTWDAAREQVQASLTDVFDDLLAGKAGSIGEFWQSFVAIGRRAFAEDLTALLFSPRQAQGVGVPGIAGGGVTLGQTGAGGVLNELFNSSRSPFSALTRGIEDLTAALGFGGGTTLGQAGVNALDALGLAGGGGASGGGGLLSGILGGGGLLGGLGSFLPFVGAGLSTLDIAGVDIGKIFAPVEKFIGGAFSGAATGASIGSIVPGIGTLIGGGIGGLIGGITSLFSSAKKSSVQIGTDDSGALVTGAQRTRGRSIDGALDLASGLFGSIQDIARQLNVDLRSGVQLGSIGTRNDRFVFDPTGANRTRGSGVEKFKTAEEATRAALSNAIAKGVFDTSDAVTRALKAFGEDIDRAVSEALSVQSLEAEIANLRDPLNAGLREFERTEKERLRLAKDYGVDLVEVEKLNARDRQKIVEESLRSAIGPLQDLLTEISQGGYADGSPAERLARLRADQQRLAGLAPGDAQAASELADVSRQLLDLSRELFGTTGNFASERATTEGLLRSLVDQANATIGGDPAAVGAAVGAAITGVLGGLPAATQENTGILNEAVGVLQTGFASVVNALQTYGGGGGGGLRADIRLTNLL